MKTQVNPVYQIVTDRILAMLEKGVAPWRKPWSAGKGGFPLNMTSGRHYSGVNVWLLYGSQFSSPYWLSFKQALDLGGNVRKGEKGTPIVFTKQLPMKEIEVETENGKEKMLDGSTGRRMLKYYTVFNIEQCDGIEDPTPVRTYDHDPIEAAEAIVAGYHDRPAIEHGGGRACYSPDLDRVLMPERNRFETADGYYHTLFHELAHSTGHEKRLKRLEPATFGSESYGKEELVAEMAAAYLSVQAGIETTLDNSAGYLQGWIEAIKKDSRLVIGAASAAQKAANHILGVTAERNPTNEESN